MTSCNRMAAAGWLTALLLVGNAGAAPQALLREAYSAERDKIEAHSDKALAQCKKTGDGSESRCQLEASGQRKIALAALEARLHPSANNSFKAKAAEVELHYDLAQAQCKKEHTGADKETRAVLKACHDKAKAERAKRLNAAQQVAAGQASVGPPPKSEAERQREADLDTAIRKCDSLLGDANLQCMRDLPPAARQRAADRASGILRNE